MTTSVRIIFIGSGELGLPALERLAPEVCGVVTAPDKPAGRGLKTFPTPVKTLALSLGLPVIETENINAAEIIAKLQSFRPEIILVAAFGQMLKKEVLEIPQKGVFNIHPSLLPKYRGAAPVEHTILNQEQETGVTIIRVTRKMDAGPILAQEKTAVRPDEDTPSLSRRLAEIGAEMAVKGLKQAAEGTAALKPQDERAATYAAKITKGDGRIDWTKDAAEISARIRAFIRWPRAYTFCHGKEIIIYGARPVNETAPLAKPGVVLMADTAGIRVACGKGALLLTELQAAGKKRLPAADFIRGFRFTEKTVLG